MSADIPTVSVVVPAYNEANIISRCLSTIIGQDHPADRLEILVVDGMSTDGTREIVREIAAKDARVRLIDNPQRIIPAAMNAGIRASRSDVVIKMDAHSDFPPDYVSRTIRALVETGAANAGGVVVATARTSTRSARGIAAALRSRFGALGSSFRTDEADAGRRPADAVAFGCWWRAMFERVGGFDERLVRSSDIELNKRIVATGGSIVLDPSIRLRYFPEAKLSVFWRRAMIDGYWAIFPYRYVTSAMSLRHLIPVMAILLVLAVLLTAPFFPPLWGAAAAGAAFYGAMVIGAGLSIAAMERDVLMAPHVASALAARHWGYAAGSLAALVQVVLGRVRQRFAPSQT